MHSFDGSVSIVNDEHSFTPVFQIESTMLEESMFFFCLHLRGIQVFRHEWFLVESTSESSGWNESNASIVYSRYSWQDATITTVRWSKGIGCRLWRRTLIGITCEARCKRNGDWSIQSACEHGKRTCSTWHKDSVNRLQSRYIDRRATEYRRIEVWRYMYPRSFRTCHRCWEYPAIRIVSPRCEWDSLCIDHQQND